MKISKNLAKNTAYLARLELSEEELEMYALQLTEIIEYVEKLKELDVKDTPATFHVLKIKNVLRKDQTKPSLETQEALKNAPEKKDNFFVVPKVF